MSENNVSTLPTRVALERAQEALTRPGGALEDLGLDVEAIEAMSAEDVLRWSLRRFGRRIALSTAFGPEGMVLIDMLSRIDPTARIFTIDTQRLPTETYSLMDRVRDQYGVTFEVYYPRPDNVDKLTTQYGFTPFYKSVGLRKLCCNVRKVEPLRRALADLDAWITAIRRDQVSTRAGAGKVEIDDKHGGIVKVNPLADWSSEQVWAYIRTHDVPYNELHDRGYPSIGCASCTRAVAPGDDPRSGRWWWEADRQGAECGIHTAPNWQV